MVWVIADVSQREGNGRIIWYINMVRGVKYAMIDCKLGAPEDSETVLYRGPLCHENSIKSTR